MLNINKIRYNFTNTLHFNLQFSKTIDQVCKKKFLELFSRFRAFPNSYILKS